MDETIEENAFKCPNCDGEEIGEMLHVSPDLKTESHNPWSKVLHRQGCASCGCLIPAHLGERWSNLTFADAKREWHEIYKETSADMK
jgi:predicted RNA-binding Zn-ribbon protein involved in translation (DUF1610 family)